MTFRMNMQHLTEVTMYNESASIIGDDGLVTRTKGDDTTLDIVLLRMGDMMFYDGNGRYTEHGITFQISEKELMDNSFTILSGRTFIEIGNDVYRVTSKTDYQLVKHTQLIQCKAVRIISAD